MKAVVVREPGQAEIAELVKPVRAEGEALLEVLYAGICGSDMGLYKGHMTGYASYPRIPGHELAARIVDIDEDNEYGLKKDMIVTVNPYFNCGTCYSCRRGYVNCCVDNKTMGLAREGVFAQYITMPLHRIYDGKGLDPVSLALIEPFCISYHAVKRANVKPGERVLVVGSGTIGIFAMMAAKIFGAEVTICDVLETKLAKAMTFGADHYILNDDNSKFADKVKETTNGDGFDVAIEAVGFPSTLMNCVDAVASVGRIVEVGIVSKTLDFQYNIIQKKEISMMGSRNALREDFEELIQMANEGKFDLKALVTAVVDYTEAPDTFKSLAANAEKNIKTLVKFND
ncbi:MAG: zinc-binding alcohol dehydrogenase family protein [Firmicutes bacterium]|nr:zinc-binding alcohol dehydrogenase family protein [Bacillota bacterium]